MYLLLALVVVSYVNAAALTKPFALQHLAADLISYQSNVAVITETHFKNAHTDAITSIDGYKLYRRDRLRRRAGGVAVYVRTTLPSSEWIYEGDDRLYEVIWVRVTNVFIAAVYHPPKPLYRAEQLLDYIESCVDALNHQYPTANIVIAGDTNQLPERDVTERTGLAQIVLQPTRGANILDRVFTSGPLYNVVRVVQSTGKSDHKAVIAYCSSDQAAKSHTKTLTRLKYRRKSPTQNALFLQNSVSVDFGCGQPFGEVQSEFDCFYNLATCLLDTFYPERTITVTSRDPPFVTADIKAKLRRKNRLMRKGRVEEAGALAKIIGNDIRQQQQNILSRIDHKSDVKQVWRVVRELTGKSQTGSASVQGITANTLNQHYASISTDSVYQAPLLKQTAATFFKEVITEFQVFRDLDHLKSTATGLDLLPAWFLRLGAPIFAKPLARLFNISLYASFVPHQWKQARIHPVPKVSTPAQPADYRPISITPIITRVMERMVVTQYIYPCLSDPPPALTFTDQFAFRPTGSTTSAIISLLNHITHMLVNNPYVVVIAIYFTKAFDTVRQATLIEKLAMLNLPDNVCNWFNSFFNQRSHCTVAQSTMVTGQATLK